MTAFLIIATIIGVCLLVYLLPEPVSQPAPTQRELWMERERLREENTIPDALRYCAGESRVLY